MPSIPQHFHPPVDASRFILKSNDFPHVIPMKSRISRQNLETRRQQVDHEDFVSCDRCRIRECRAERERRAAKRQVFCWRATTGKRGPRGADQKRSRVSSRRRRRQRTSQRSPSIHVRFHAPGVLPIGSWESARQSTNARLTGSGLVPRSRRGHRQR